MSKHLHIMAPEGAIAETVLLPGDPLRAKFIAENFLEDAVCYNEVRGMYAYTGTYKGKEVTIMASGMGMPSMGIYSYELYKFYDVENIIRIGSCGSYKPELKLFDIVLAKQVFSEGNFAYTLNNDNCHLVNSSDYLNSILEKTANGLNINICEGNTVCTDCFDVYMTDVSKFLARVPKNFNPVSAEMEAFALFYVAKMLNKNASCLMSVVDSKFIKDVATPEERQSGLNNMITLALESSLNLN